MARPSELAGQGAISQNNADSWDDAYVPDYGDGGGDYGGGYDNGGYDNGGYDNGGYTDNGVYGYGEQQPEYPEPEEGRAWDIHYTPSWFVEEQTNRKDPLYEKDENWTDQQVDALANYVTGKQQSNPDEWRYGDPGWNRADSIWQETIKPVEDAWQEAEQQRQAEAAPEQQNNQYYSFHNNNVNTTDLAIRQEGNDLAPIRTQEEVDKIKAGYQDPLHKIDTSQADYERMSNSEKLIYMGTPSTAGTDVKNAKWYQRFTAPVMGAFFSASGPATVAKLLVTAFGGPAGLIYGAVWGATAGYSYLKGSGVIQGNEYIDKFIELTDILDEKGAQAQGALAYGWEKAGGGDWTDWSKAGENLDFMINNFGTIMHYAFGEGKASSEYNKDVVGIVTGLTPNMGANVIGVNGQGMSRMARNALSFAFDKPEDRIRLERGQTTRANSGLTGVYDLPEELLGTNAITYWLNYGQYLYDHGITNTKQLEFEINNAINQVYGDLSNFSEFIEHELGDAGNFGESVVQPRAIQAYGHITNDVNLAKAADFNVKSLAADVASNIPVIPGVMSVTDLINGVAKLAGKPEVMQTSGGIDEIINTWDMENLSSTDPSSLTARDRRLSGIKEDGSLKSLNPLTNPNTIKNPFARGAEKIKQLFQTTPEWRASMAGDSIMNFINTGIEDALRARPNDDANTRAARMRTFVDELEHPETISKESPFAQQSKTILFNSIKEDLSMAIRSRRAEIDKAIDDYFKLEPHRQVLDTLSKALGLSPDKVIDKYQNQKTVLAQMIINKADENGGTIPSIKFQDGTPIPVDSRAFGDHVMNMIAPFTGKDAKPYDPRALMTQITTKIGDGVTETLINKYDIQQEGWVYRFGDTIKKMQQLWLLGLSPSYLANNVTNNVLTRSALGIGGFLTPKTINNWQERFGYTPERFAESTVETAMGKSWEQKTPSENLRESIRAQKRGKHKNLDKIDKNLDWVSEHAGIFGKLSGKIEELESKQIYASSMMTYMARTWKPGVNFRKMDPQLENLIRSQNPAMLDAIYVAISAGVNMKEIEEAIYGTYVVPSVKDTLVEAARNIGITNAEDAVTEIFDKGGIMTELMAALKGKRGDEIDAVVQKAAKRIKMYADKKLRSDLAGRAEQIANDTSGYKFAEAIKLGQDLAQNMSDLWLENQLSNTQLFDRRIRDGLGATEFHKLYQEHQKEFNERWKGIYAEAQQTYSGILKGLGFADQTANKYVDLMRERDNLWVNFNGKKQPELFQPYLDALIVQPGEKFAQWDSRVKQAWKDYLDASNAEYKKTVAAELRKQKQMDDLFAKGLKAALGNINAQKVTDVIIPLQEEIRNIRQQIIDQNLAIREVTDATNILNEKSQKYHEMDAERQELKDKYREKQQELYAEIQKLGPQTEAQAADSVKTEVDYKANIRNAISQMEAEEQQKVADQLSKMDAEDIENDVDLDEEYRTTLEKQLEELDKKNEAIQARINELIAENNLEKNREELMRLNNELAGNNIHAKLIEDTLTELDDGITPGSWTAELNRKSAYKIAKKLGADEDVAVAISRLNKIYIDEWETNHPGRKYKSVGDMTVSFTNEDRTVPIQGADGQLYQVENITSLFNDEDLDELIAPLIIDEIDAEWKERQRRDAIENSENFKEWHGDHPENFNSDGTALTVWHGSDEIFTEFDNSYLGSNTHAQSAKMGIFTTSRKENAENYVRGGRSSLNKNELILTRVYELPYFQKYYSNPLHEHYEAPFDIYDLNEFLPKVREIQKKVNEAYPMLKGDTSLVDIANSIEERLSKLDSDIFNGQSIEEWVNTPLNRAMLSDEEFDIAREVKYLNADINILRRASKTGELSIPNKDDIIQSLEEILSVPDPNPYVREFYLSFKNPYVIDYGGKRRNEIKPFYQAIREAIDGGYDAVILKNTYDPDLADMYVVFNENQLKSVYNGGEFSEKNNLYHQEAEQRIKGQFSIEDGQKLVELFKGSDISTLIHEVMGHGWATTLNDNQVEALAAYNGWTAERYRQLENQWYNDPKSMSNADRIAWMDAQEKFAYGFEQYLLEGNAPNEAMKQIFETLKRYLLQVYQGVRHLVYKGAPIDIHAAQHGVTLAEIFDSMLVDSNREFNIDREGLTDVQSNSIVDESGGYAIPESIRQFLMTDSAKRAEKIKTMKADAEESMRMETQMFLEENKKWGLTEPELQELVTEIMHSLGLNIGLPEDMVLMVNVQEKMNRFPGGEKAIKRFVEEHRATAAKISDTSMDAMLKNNGTPERLDDVYKYVLQQVDSEDQVKKHGDFVKATEPFIHGKYTADRVVYHNSEIVAFLPQGMEPETIEIGDGKTATIIGVSVQDPALRMYEYNGEIYEEPKPQQNTGNVFNADAEPDSLGALDPEGQANHEITYKQTLDILKEFGRVYKTALNDAMANNIFSSLNDETKELVRQYIDYDVRQDLMNTKYKAGKFGEMMRDASLLNYSKRYGFDNALTLLFPYQFWQTRSAWNWMQRMGGKGGKMWRRYARLKDMEERNKKELMPSRVTGKIGIYLPFLPDWMGDALFMPTSQLSIVGNFMDPLDDWLTDNKAVNATAERYVQEAFDAGDISRQEYQLAMDPAKRSGSAVWAEMFARAQQTGDHDRDLGSLFKQYFGLSLPISIGKALMTGDSTAWTQMPMSRTGTAFRAMFGDNIIGNGLEKAMSAPERAMRKAAVAITGNNDFRYQEFGNWGDYYIRNQVWDMVVEGKIGADDAVKACAEKDGNTYWEQAADRQRMELLQKTQILSTTMPFKKMVEDVRNGERDKLGDDFKYLMAEVLTTLTPTSVVRDAERTWRADKAEMNKLYDTGTKEDRSKFYDQHPYYTYNNLRYEADPEQSLRSFLYKSIMDRWYDLEADEKDELKMAFGTDFQRSILSEETRAYQTMDLNRLAAYAQAMNGSIPYLATEKLNTMNVPRINTNVIPRNEQISQRQYLKERERLYPGMADVSNIYYQLPVEDRKIFRQMNPQLTKYWDWNRQYKKDHPEVENYQKRRTDYYDTLHAEDVFSKLDPFTIKELTRAAYTKGKVDKIYEPVIARAMMSSGVTDDYDDFVKILTDYILGG